MLPATLAKEEKKVTRGFQAHLYQDQVEGMGSQALLGPPGPLGSQATQVSSLWGCFSAVPCRIGCRAELRGWGGHPRVCGTNAVVPKLYESLIAHLGICQISDSMERNSKNKIIKLVRGIRTLLTCSESPGV